MIQDYKISEFAAIAIPTLNRYGHFVRCIESLKKNRYSEYTDLYISLDYAPNERYENGRKQIEDYLDHGIQGFAHVYVHKHDKNLGAKNNSDYVMKWVSNSHERYIFSEDDNEFAPNYLEFVNKLLEQYANDDCVIAISGYNYPIDTNGTGEEIYFGSTYFAAFGFAGWFNKLYVMQERMTADWIRSIYKDLSFMNELRQKAPNQYCNFIKGMVGYTPLLENNEEVSKIDLTYGLYMFSYGKKMIFPVLSKVRNWGYDGSGVNCDVMEYDPQKPVTHRNYGFDCQKLDERAECVGLKLVSESENKTIIDEVNRFFYVPNKEVLRSCLAYLVSRIVGIDILRKIWKK